MAISVYLILSKSINIHFNALEKFPLNLIYYINRKNTYFFDSNSWGTDKLTLKTDAIFYKNRNLEDHNVKNYHYLVAFNNHWDQIKYAKKYNKTFFIINPSRILNRWKKVIEDLAFYEKKPYSQNG